MPPKKLQSDLSVNVEPVTVLGSKRNLRWDATKLAPGGSVRRDSQSIKTLKGRYDNRTLLRITQKKHEIFHPDRVYL